MGLDHRNDSPKSMPLRRKQSNIVVASSKIFTLDKVQVYKTMPLIKSLPNTTNEGQTLGFHSRNHDFVLEMVGMLHLVYQSRPSR
jgi:hypothetical protein